MKKYQKIFLFIITFLFTIVTLFPPSKPSGFVFLFSNNIKIDLTKFILFYFLSIFISVITTALYIKVNRSVRYILISILFSLILSSVFYFTYPSTSMFFTPSKNELNILSEFTSNKYSVVFNQVRSKLNFDEYQSKQSIENEICGLLYAHFYNKSGNKKKSIDAFNALILPKEHFPSIDKYLVDLDTIPSISADASFEARLVYYLTYDFDTFILVDSVYKSYFVIPTNHTFLDYELSKAIYFAKEEYFSKYLKQMFDYYLIRNEYIKSYYSFIEKSVNYRFIITVFSFIVFFIIILFFKNSISKFYVFLVD